MNDLFSIKTVPPIPNGRSFFIFVCVVNGIAAGVVLLVPLVLKKYFSASPVVAGIIGGLFCGHLISTALCNALQPEPEAQSRLGRGVWMVLLPFLFAFTLALASRKLDAFVPLFLFAIFLMCLWSMVRGGLRHVLHGIGMQLVSVNEFADLSSAGNLQFGIGTLMKWTAIVAAVLGIGRLLVVTLDQGSTLLLLAVLSSVPVGSLVLALLATLTLLRPRRGGVLWVLTIAWLVAFTVYEEWMFQSVNRRLPGAVAEFFWPMNISQYLVVAGNLLLLRAAGFRLTRARPLTTAQATSSA